MNLPPAISTALDLLETEYDGLLCSIEALRQNHRALDPLPLSSFEEQMRLYKRRDQLANVRNNLRAYYDAE